MSRRRETFLNALVLLALVAGVSAAFWQASTSGQIAEYARDIRREKMPTLRSSWKDADNVTQEVETPWIPGDTAQSQATRHQESVEALKAIYPPKS